VAGRVEPGRDRAGTVARLDVLVEDRADDRRGGGVGQEGRGPPRGTWGPSAEATYAYLMNTARDEAPIPSKVSTIIAALRADIGENQMMALPALDQQSPDARCRLSYSR
jgi:hypothetical protein